MMQRNYLEPAICYSQESISSAGLVYHYEPRGGGRGGEEEEEKESV